MRTRDLQIVGTLAGVALSAAACWFGLRLAFWILERAEAIMLSSAPW